MTGTSISVAAIPFESARRFGDRIAIEDGHACVTYAELWDQIRAYAGALRERGIRAGDVVAMLVPNVIDFARVYYAVLSLGAIALPVHALLKQDEIKFVLQDSRARMLVCAAPLLMYGRAGADLAGVPITTVLADNTAGDLDRLEDLAARALPIETYEPRDGADAATILYTSGTTGHPKGALGSHFSIVEQTSVLIASTMGITRNDVVFGGLPLFHTFGQTVALNTSMRAGAKVVLLPRFEGEAALDVLIASECTVMMGVPSMYVALLAAAFSRDDRPSLRVAISGGSSIPVAVMERFEAEFGIAINEGYGLTETSPVATFNHVGETIVPGSIGVPIWGVEVEIADAAEEDSIALLAPDQLGEIVVRGHNIMKGYLNQPEETAKAIVDGWFRTGDLGRKSSDGHLWIVDRKKDMILRNGYNVYPREVEEVLAAHPQIVNVAVFGVSDPVRGQEIMACVVPHEGATLSAEAVIEYGKSRLAAYKYPRRVELVDTLPLGPSGKVLKRELARRYSEDA